FYLYNLMMTTKRYTLSLHDALPIYSRRLCKKVVGRVCEMSAEKVTIQEKVATGLAQSKLILVGEHSVVHGQPAISIPFSLVGVEDRKSTRLNSSHVSISYAVFCLKK